MANQPPNDNEPQDDIPVEDSEVPAQEGAAEEEPEPPAAESGGEPPKKDRWDDKVVAFVKPRWEKHKGKFFVALFVLCFLFALFFNNIFISIMSGQAGVKWYRWSGTNTHKTYSEGLHIIFPWDKMYIYETRVQEVETRFYALSKNGLRIYMHASVRFRPKREILPLLHKEIGPDYVNRVIIPEVQSAIRRVIGAYNPEDIYGSQGGILNNVVLIAVSEIGERYIQVDDLLIREIRLPDQVAESIEMKLKEEQRFLEYEYRLQRERQEAERKAIEGEGIARFQAAVSAGINENYLRFKGIQATLELAQSHNAKVVLIGGKDGLPMILNLPDATQKGPKPPLLDPTLMPAKDVDAGVPPPPSDNAVR